MKTPTPSEIKEARLKAGLSQEKSAEMIGRTARTWIYWENGDFSMPSGLWELYVSKTQKGGADVGMTAAIVVLMLCAICAVSASDYDAELAQQSNYCDMVKKNIWPDYKGTYSDVCKRIDN